MDKKTIKKIAKILGEPDEPLQKIRKREIPQFRAWYCGNMFYFDLIDLFNSTTMHCGETYRYEDEMQYVGIKDKNDIKIFEGDILKHLAIYPDDFVERNPHLAYGRICGGVVRKNGWIYIDENTKNPILLTDSNSKEWEVIGDIYRNPELLKNGLEPEY
jgi:uncharacterized phage protein (TIGR01671 family)